MMKKKLIIRAGAVSEILSQYVPNPQIPLCYNSAYTLLVAVLLSARCSDLRVNKVTKILFAKASSPEEMVKLSTVEIIGIVRPCGLSKQKGLAIWNLSRILVEQYVSVVPDSLEKLITLPGVGRKTAQVVLSQWFKKPAFPVDTHIYRSAKRWGLSSCNTRTGVEKDLVSLFPKKDWGQLHLRIILFARKYCPALGHQSVTCPMCSYLQNFN
jgi:endonuclease-3